MSGRKCQNCGSTDIESDAARADAICTGCGTVLESGMIVSDVTFMDNGAGGMSAIGTFVSGERKGGSNTFGGNFQTGVGRESREITLKNARTKIVGLAQQLRLRQDHVDMSFYFYKLALSKVMTRGRKSPNVIAACVYITCRTEGTSHMLIDFSDVLQVDVYELGRTYLKLSHALCINIPAMDPCLYVMRFAHKLEFGDKAHEVSMTALRLVSRMKKDWIHFGRRPSGLCGAALLIASRLHDFNRCFEDIIKVVKVHESTLRKRLNEFGQTSASQLTLEEFMTADLDAMTEEMDPPCYQAARKREEEVLARVGEMSAIDKEIRQLEKKIEKELEERRLTKRSPDRLSSCSSLDSLGRCSSSSSSGSEVDEGRCKEVEDLQNFLQAETMGIMEECVGSVPANFDSDRMLDSLLMPPPSSPPVFPRSPATPRRLEGISACSPGLGLKDTVEEYMRPTGGQTEVASEVDLGHELDLTGIDDDEIDSYLMTPMEVKNKTFMWMEVNKDYLKEQKVKVKKEKLDREEMIKNGIDPDKKKKVYKKKSPTGTHNSAVDAIEKMAADKKISTKINYDVLKNLSFSSPSPKPASGPEEEKAHCKTEELEPMLANSTLTLSGVKRFQTSVNSWSVKKFKIEKKPVLLARAGSRKQPLQDSTSGEGGSLEDLSTVVESDPVVPEEEDLSDLSDDEEPLQSAADLLGQQYGGGGGDEWGEEEYY